ncbi:arsenate reductase family protein [Ligilactobacillus equi]|uniref:arsenate reductase family protein n=1 Tax=Ligilactobacillus equi TaxID=137357 RepID=UPI002ED14457
MTIFYCYKRCSTCKKAQKWLDDHQVSYESQDLVDFPPKKADLIAWMTKYQDRGIRYFFNTSGQDYRKLGLKDRVTEMTIEEAAEMMAQNGKLIKRPLMVNEHALTCGFKEEIYQATWL